MRPEGAKAGFGAALALTIFAAFSPAGVAPVPAQSVPTVAAPVTPSAPLAWDALEKELTPKPEAETAEFTFNVTNVSDKVFTIDYLETSCGCTVASIPSEPWHLASHTNGQIAISVDLAGKMGTFSKTVDVISGKDSIQTLVVTVHLPDGTDEARARNQRMAMADRQAVFKGDCARCHAEPGNGKLGRELYAAVCAICHEAKPRATAVPNLNALNRPTDYNFWKQWTSEGKPATMMPAFAAKLGGPLNDEQLESLARTLTQMFPSRPAPAPTNAVPAVRTNGNAAR